MKIKRGSTSVRRLIFVADSSSTSGAGLANLSYNTSGLVAYYFAGDLSDEVAITLASATLGTWTSGGFVAVDNTNMPGWYEIGIPNAALDGGNEVAIQLRGASNMVPVNIYIELDAIDYQAGKVAGVSGDVEGKVLGGGSGTISAVGARVVDYDGQNVAPAATALSSATWTNSLATALATAATNVATLLTRIIGTLASGTHQPQSGDAYPPAASAASSSSSAASSASTAAVAAAAALSIVDHADYGNEALADAIAAIDVGTGTGPNQVNVTVSSSAGGTVQGVSVRMQATGLGDHTATTNDSGVARFNLPSGTWSLTAALNGYSYAGSTQVVSTNPQPIAITMTVTSVSSPSSPSKSVGVLLCLDTSGDPESGVTVSFQMVAGPGDDGYSLDAAIVEEDCDSEGILEREFLRGATYDAWRGVRGARVRFVVPDAASFNLPEQLGVD